MDIDITKPEGNTLVALSYAARLMRESGIDREDIKKLREAVFAADNPQAARALIEAATHRAIRFVDPREE